MASASNQPVVSPPPGQQVDLVNHPNQGYLIVITYVVCVSCVLPVVGIRMYVSLRVTKNLRLDDFLVVLATILVMVYGALGLAMTRHEAFVDVWNIPLDELIQLKRLIYVALIIQSNVILIIKVAVLLLYKRIFVPIQMKHFWVQYIIMTVIGFNILFYTANTFAQAFICTPVVRIWDRSVPGTCINEAALIISAAALNVVSDLFILIIPVAVICQLSMAPKRKIELLFIFICGILCCVSSIARLVYSILNISDTNQPMATLKVGLWTAGEIISCFLAACIPMVPQLKNHLRRRRSGSTGHSLCCSNSQSHSGPSIPASRRLRSVHHISLWENDPDGEEDPYLMVEQRNTNIEPLNRSAGDADAFVSETPVKGISNESMLIVTRPHE